MLALILALLAPPAWPDGAVLLVDTAQLLYDRPPKSADEAMARVGRYAVDLRWPPVTGAVSYEVSRDGRIVAHVTGTTFADKPVGPHRYAVRARDADGRSSPPLEADARWRAPWATPADPTVGESIGVLRGTVPVPRWLDVGAQGPLPAEVVRRIVRRHRDEIRDRYATLAAERPRVEVRLDLTIAPEGRVSAATAHVDPPLPALAEAIATAARRWAFPAAPRVTTASVKFELSRDGGGIPASIPTEPRLPP